MCGVVWWGAQWKVRSVRDGLLMAVITYKKCSVPRNVVCLHRAPVPSARHVPATEPALRVCWSNSRGSHAAPGMFFSLRVLCFPVLPLFPLMYV